MSAFASDTAVISAGILVIAIRILGTCSGDGVRSINAPAGRIAAHAFAAGYSTMSAFASITAVICAGILVIAIRTHGTFRSDGNRCMNAPAGRIAAVLRLGIAIIATEAFSAYAIAIGAFISCRAGIAVIT